MSKTITVYWAGFNEQVNFINTNMWYSDPKNLFKDMVEQRVDNRDDTLFRCPAIRDKATNTYYFENQIPSTVTFLHDGTLGWEGVTCKSVRDPSISGTKHISFNLSWIFYTDEPLEASFTPPYFHKNSYLPDMTFPAAKFNIGSWFRPFNAEFMLWNADTKQVVLPSGMPLFYAEFHTDANIKFQRFECTDKIAKYAMACTFTPKLLGRFKPLSERYDLFKRTRMNSAVMREIKDNLI